MTTDLPGPDAASGGHRPPLNYYGELVRRQWEGCLPDVYQQIRHPGPFFAVLGEVIAHRMDELADHLAGDDQHGEGYLAKVARLTAAREHAQERVLGDYLLLPPDEDRPVSWIAATRHGRRSMPSSGNGSVSRPARRAGRDLAREQPAVLDRARTHRDRRDQIGQDIGLVVFLNCFPVAWPAALVVACMMPRKAD